MADVGKLRELILRQCAAAAPEPWYPSIFARDNPVPRDEFDHDLSELRLGGLVRIVDWAQGKGQGYALTPEGTSVLQDDRELARLRSGKLDLRPESQRSADGATSLEGTTFDRGESVRRAVFYPERATLTRALIITNVTVFAAGMALAAHYKIPVGEYLYGENTANVHAIMEGIGALDGTKILQGEWLRLLTCCFVHFGLLHLGVNMYSLHVLGTIQEGMWGKFRMLAIYLIAGIGGSCAMVINDPRTFGAGASGAIFGLMGSLGTWIFLNRRHLGPIARPWLRRLVILLILNSFISALPGISASAHFGGLAFGIVAALLLHAERHGHGMARAFAVLAILALPAVGIGAVLKAQNMDSRWAEPRARLVEQLWYEVNELESDQVEPLLSPRQKMSVAEKKDRLEAAYRRMITKLDKAIVLLQNAGPYQQAESEELRREYLERIQKRRTEIDAKMKRLEKAPEKLELQAELEQAKKCLAQLSSQKSRAPPDVEAIRGRWDRREAQTVKQLQQRLQQFPN